jgi:hypothetical protein
LINVSISSVQFPKILENRSAMIVGTTCLGFVVALAIVDALILSSVTAMEIAGSLMRLVMPMAIIAAVLWRAAELGARWVFQDEGRLASWADRWLQNYWMPFIIVAVAIIVYQLPVLAAQVGILATSLGGGRALGGVLPLGSAKPFYGAAIGMLTDGTIGPLAGQRPLHSLNISTLFLLNGFSRTLVLLTQAALCGLFTGLVGLAIARKFGPAVGLAAWALCFAVAAGTLPSFMSEPSGIWMGHAALVVLIGGAALWSPRILGLGIGALMLAFSARAGAMFLIPALFVAGVILFYKDWQQIRRFLIFGSLATVVALAIPQIAHRLYDDRGGTYQANFGFILYQFAVNGKSWRQVRKDYPDKTSNMRKEELDSFIWSKAIEKINENPSTFVYTFYERLVQSSAEISSGIISATRESVTKSSQEVLTIARKNQLLLILIYFGGLAWLICYCLETWRQRAIAGAIVAGYLASLPFIWLGGSIRPQAATWMLMVLPMAGLLGRRVGGYALARSRRQAPTLWLARGLFVWALVISVTPYIHEQLFSFKRTAEYSPPMQDDEALALLVLGPHVPFVRLRDGSAGTRMIRPDITFAEFKSLFRGKRDDSWLGPYSNGEQLTLAVDNWRSTHRYLWSQPFCMPDRLWVFQATIVHNAKGAYRIRKIVPVQHNGKPFPKDAKLPFNCL